MDQLHPFTPGSLSTTSVSRRSRTTPSLQKDAPSQRLRLVLPVAALVVLAVSFQQVAQPDLAAVYRDPVVRLITLAAVLLAVGLFALHHFGQVLPSTWIPLWMAFAVFVAFTIAIVETAVPVTADRPVLGMSAVGPWILLVCVLVANRPSWTLATALAAASMWPVAYAINAQRLGFSPAPWSRLLVWPVVNYLLAVLGFLIARHLYAVAATAAGGELGRYRLLAPIGAGGMGEVWKASHGMLARQAAIKLVRPRTTAPSARQADLWVERFRREANVIAGLQSPHTIYLYDFGVSNDGQFYYAMELLDGISLETLVNTFGPQPVGRVR